MNEHAIIDEVHADLLDYLARKLDAPSLTSTLTAIIRAAAVKNKIITLKHANALARAEQELPNG